MIKCYCLKDTHKQKFYKLFTDYYAELDCDDAAQHLLDEYVLPDYISGLLAIDLLDDGDETVGFVIYQIDAADNEWCVKAGWGDVREIYVAPSHRRQGLGKFMLYTAELKLREGGAERAYALPNDEAIPFFTACGYADSGERCEDLDCNVFTKDSLINTCKHCK